MKPIRSQFPNSFAPTPSGSVWKEFGDNQSPDRVINVSGEPNADYALDGRIPSKWSSALKSYQQADLPEPSKTDSPPAPKKRAKKKC